MRRHRKAGHALRKRYWSHKVKTHFHPEGLFTRSAHAIAKELRRRSADAGQAVKRLTFYINRAGHNLTEATRSKLHHAVRILERGL